MSKIIPAILTANEESYRTMLRQAELVSELIQIDIIDGRFADNKTISLDAVGKNKSSSKLEIQLMVSNLQSYVDQSLGNSDISRIVVPFEGHGLPEVIDQIKKNGIMVGLSLNPKTPVASALHLIEMVDFLLFLAVEPGFSGQTFQDHVIDKIKEAKSKFGDLEIEVDGGINMKNAKIISEAGADLLAVNSSLFNADDFKGAFETLSDLVKE